MHVGSLRRQQPEHRLGNLLDRPHTAQRGGLAGGAGEIDVRGRLLDVGGDDTGPDCVDANALGPDLPGQADGETVDGAVGSGVVAPAG